MPSDIYSRYLRLQGKDVAFVCGSDEHGVAISMKAKKENITPQEVIDKYDAIIRKSFIDFGISFDNYSRTSSKIHHETASAFFKKLYEDEFGMPGGEPFGALIGDYEITNHPEDIDLLEKISGVCAAAHCPDP